jgi:hypothetical protein
MQGAAISQRKVRLLRNHRGASAQLVSRKEALSSAAIEGLNNKIRVVTSDNRNIFTLSET